MVENVEHFAQVSQIGFFIGKSNEKSQMEIFMEEKPLEQLILQANEYYYARDFENAIALYRRILDLDPHNELVWNNMSNAMSMKSGRMRGT
jgi:tetratricopeptide (TPR) repeat protein